MNPDEYPEWLPTVSTIVESGGLVLLIGGIDTGKTTFAAVLARAACAAGKRVAVVDADVGQSEIGPPGCVGLGILESPAGSLAAARLAGLAFVGNVSPRGCMLEHLVAVGRMAVQASESHPDLTIVDTTGFIQGASALRLKQAKADLLRPRHIVALQRSSECESILRGMSDPASGAVHRLAVPAVIVRKPASYRAQRRAARFAAYFGDAQRRDILFDHTAFTHTWLNKTTPVAPHILKFLSHSAGVRIRHAELSGRFLGMAADGLPLKELNLIHEEFKPDAITVSPVSRYSNLLVGLSDSNHCQGIGLITEVDFTRRKLTILTPVRSITGIRRVDFGIIRVRPDGRELGVLRPGDV